MPFTPAHAAAALPFLRSRLVPSALLIGTFAPDFEYFLRFSPSSGFGHTWIGIFVLSLPLALAVLYVYQVTVRSFLLALMPESFQSRLKESSRPFLFFPQSRFGWILLSLSLGIATHVVWDNFTHPNSWLALHWPLLRRTVRLPLIGVLPSSKLLQQISTLAGLGILMAWLLRWYRTTPKSTSLSFRTLSKAQKRSTVLLLVALASAGVYLRVELWPILINPTEVRRPLAVLASEGICTYIALLWWQLVLYGFFFHAVCKSDPTRDIGRSDRSTGEGFKR